jgi:hypothetical protein
MKRSNSNFEIIYSFSFTRTQCLPSNFFRELLGASANEESQLEKFIDLINAVVNDVREILVFEMILIFILGFIW